MSTLTHTDVPTFTPTATQIDCEEENVTIKVLPSVVSVYIRKPQEIVTGTGFIVDSENGYIITASHVIAGAEPGNIEVRFRDGSAKSAYYVAHYTDADIALLSVGHTGFPALPFVSNLSDISLSQGKPLIAIGMV
ncbi:MAG: trypsin-like peptidase domain-containing protein, partial [SAR202 cluster bacterium]|nr:trypsin-like peptidase domain-containing protein [SAR202 cluster bacterium]